MTDHLDLYSVELTLTTGGGSLTDELPPGTPEHIDATPAIDHLGRPIIPGPTVAGSLRSHLAARDPDLAHRLFGSAGAESARSSRLRVVGVVPLDVSLAVDRGTAIDRTRGAARTFNLRSVQRFEAGSRLCIFLRIDDLDSDDKQQWEAALVSWHPTLGSGVSSGRGEATVDRIRAGRLSLGTREGLRDFLSMSGPALFDKIADELLSLVPAGKPRRWQRVFRLASDLFSWDGNQAEGNLRCTRTVRIGAGAEVPMLTGRTLKGIWRSRTEYILESVGLPRCTEATCGSCLACQIFGWQGAEAGARAATRTSDSLVSGAMLVDRTHIAIDRFTGGVANARSRRSASGGDEVMELEPSGLLFTHRVARGGELTVTIDALDADDELWASAQALFALVAWDLHEGLVGVGGATTRES